MCRHGTYKEVEVINPNQNKKRVVVDACISDEIQELNRKGIITLSCCCGHGLAGEIIEYENGFGKWKEKTSPPHTLIDEGSVDKARSLGYRPYHYYYADGIQNGVWEMLLKTGCMTRDDCVEWHEQSEKLDYVQIGGEK